MFGQADSPLAPNMRHCRSRHVTTQAARPCLQHDNEAERHHEQNLFLSNSYASKYLNAAVNRNCDAGKKMRRIRRGKESRRNRVHTNLWHARLYALHRFVVDKK
jgi:hypothetical protein